MILHAALYAAPSARQQTSTLRGEEIELGNDLDRERDIDRDRHVIFVAGEPRQLTPVFWQPFTLLCRCRGTVVSSAYLLKRQRENLRLLRKLLVGSRYQIVNHRDIGYELGSPSSDTVAPKATLPAIEPAMYYLAAWCVITGLAFLIWGIEVKGRSIEEIDAALTRSTPVKAPAE